MAARSAPTIISTSTMTSLNGEKRMVGNDSHNGNDDNNNIQQPKLKKS